MLLASPPSFKVSTAVNSIFIKDSLNGKVVFELPLLDQREGKMLNDAKNVLVEVFAEKLIRLGKDEASVLRMVEECERYLKKKGLFRLERHRLRVRDWEEFGCMVLSWNS